MGKFMRFMGSIAALPLILMIGCTALAANAGGDNCEIVRDGHAGAVIVVDPDAPRMVRYAAEELQTYIRKITGATLPIVDIEPADGQACIFVGESGGTRRRGLSIDGLESDGFRIMSGDNWLALFGRESEPVFADNHLLRASDALHPATGISRFGETGALYAVYHFLRAQCGVRWYMPGELGEVVPKQPTIQIGALDETHAPDYGYRFAYTADFRVDDEAVYWYRRTGYGTPTPVWINHSFFRFNKYRDTHPEYYALLPDGSRDFDVTGDPPGNFCLSEPAVVDMFVTEIRAYFDAHPRERIFPVMPNDGWSRICECDRCQAQVKSGSDKGRYSDYTWGFVNEVAKHLYVSHPDKIIGCCAYAAYLEPPQSIDKLSPNVAVMIATAPRMTAVTDEYKAFVEAWRRKADILYRWEYYLYGYNNQVVQGLPAVYIGNIVEDLRFLKGKSSGEFVEAESWRARTEDSRSMHYPGMTHLNLYVTGKLLWDVDTDVDALLEEYYTAFYGPAREPMKAFWQLAEQLWAEAQSPGQSLQLFDVFNEEAVNGLYGCLERGIAATAPDTDYRRRVELIRDEFAPVRERVRNTRIREQVTASIPHIGDAPVIDGRLDDAVWQQAQQIDFVGLTGAAPEQKTDVRLAWDDDSLYVAFVNEEPAPPDMCYLATERDGRTKPYIWDDDSVEIFINTHPLQDKCYYQFIINARGTLWDGATTAEDGRKDSFLWNSGFEAATQIGQGEWTAEVRIPLADLGVTDPTGKRFSANFYRNRVVARAGMQYTCWSPTLVFNHHNTARFGFITLAEQE